MADIFVSYARPDRERVRPLVALLESHGWSVWWDYDIVPGEAFERLIDTEIQQARCVVAIWTRDAVLSDWVQAEAGDGLDRGILVPVMFDDVRVPVAFRRTDTANLVGWPRRRNEEEARRFLAGVSQCLGQEPNPEHLSAESFSAHPLRSSSGKKLRAGAVVAFLGLIAIFLLGWDWQRQPESGTDPDTVSISIDQFVDSQNRNLGLEYELERRLQSSPGLTARVRADGRSESDYRLTAELHGDVLTIDLRDRNGIQILSQSETLDEDLAALADNLSRSLLGRLGRNADFVSRFYSDLPPDVYRDYMSASRALRQSISVEVLARAESAYLRVIAQAPRFAPAHAGLCRTYLWRYIETLDQEAVTSAEQHCHRALTLDSRDSTVHGALGMLYRETGLLPDSIDSYRQALALAPYSTDAMRGLAATLARTESEQEAEYWFRQAIDIEPTYWENYHALGSFLFNMNRFNDAEESFLTALTLAPTESRVLNNLGAVSFLSNQFAQAVEYWQRAAELQPAAYTLANLGSAYYFLRDYQAAADKYLEARDLTPQSHIAWGHVADALYAGRLDGFRENYLKAIELASSELVIDPENRWTLSSLGAYHAALGNKEVALDFVDKAAGDDDMDVVYDTAVSFARLGIFPEAAVQLEKLESLGYPTELISRDANFDTIVTTAGHET